MCPPEGFEINRLERCLIEIIFISIREEGYNVVGKRESSFQISANVLLVVVS